MSGREYRRTSKPQIGDSTPTAAVFDAEPVAVVAIVVVVAVVVLGVTERGTNKAKEWARRV